MKYLFLICTLLLLMCCALACSDQANTIRATEKEDVSESLKDEEIDSDGDRDSDEDDESDSNDDPKPDNNDDDKQPDESDEDDNGAKDKDDDDHDDDTEETVDHDDVDDSLSNEVTDSDTEEEQKDTQQQGSDEDPVDTDEVDTEDTGDTGDSEDTSDDVEPIPTDTESADADNEDTDEQEELPSCDVEPTTLKEAGACTGRLIGAALAASRLRDGGYSNTAVQEHNYVTAENEMKWNAQEPSRGNFNFSSGDQIVNFAIQNGLDVKGHTLVWHSQLPSWVEMLGSENDVRSVMKNHIETVMDYYRGKVISWDVVNEAWETDLDNGDGNPRLRDSVFYRYLGETFIDEAFEIAEGMDPEATLYYNDFSIEGLNDKSDAVYEMVKGMVERGVPIDGVGMQTHIGTPNDYPTADEVAENMKRFADLGIEIIISEMDIHICGGQTVEWQELLYHDITAACVAQPACTAITFWGINDGSSWLNTWDKTGCNGQNPSPLLFDDGFGKKGTYQAVMDALLGR